MRKFATLLCCWVLLLSMCTIQGSSSSSFYEDVLTRFLQVLKDRFLSNKRDIISVCTKVECLDLDSECNPFEDGLPCDCHACLDEADECFDHLENLTLSANISSQLACNCFKALKACLSATNQDQCQPLAFLFQEECRNLTNFNSTTSNNNSTTNSTCDCSVPDFDPNTGFSALTLRTCSMNAYCDSVSRTCKDLKREGEICRDIKTGPFQAQECGNSQLPFVTNWEFVCENGICGRRGFANVTDGCNTTADCFLSDLGRVTCDNGTCKGVAQGDTCEFSAECGFGLFCKNKVCSPQSKAGVTCDPDNDTPCLPWLLCGLDLNRDFKCVRKINSSEGEPCIATTQCKLGTFCWNDTCHLVPETLVPCAVDEDCTEAGFSCQCDVLEGRSKCTPRRGLFGSVNIDARCQGAYERALQCVQDHECKHELSTDLRSCPISNCFSEASCAILCAGETTLKPLIDAGCLELPSILSCPTSPTAP